jgi:hypothetical protein
MPAAGAKALVVRQLSESEFFQLVMAESHFGVHDLAKRLLFYHLSQR